MPKSIGHGFYICRPRHYNLICWELNLKSGSFAFFWLIKWMDGIHKYDWCHAGWMLTQELTPDPTCKLNILSFLALPHLLDSLICTRNSTSIVLLLKMIRGWYRWEVGVVDLYQGVCEGTGDGYYLIVVGFFVTFDFVFCSLMSSVSFF